MTLEEILNVIKEATKCFGDIAVKTTNDDLSCMEKTLLTILFKIPYDQLEATHSLSDIIVTSAKYTKKYGAAFNRPTRPEPHCPTITATMFDAD